MKNFADYFIVKLSPADLLTLTSLFFALVSIIQILAKNFYLAISFMFLGNLADVFDGIIARNFRWESDFGRYLDGFVDVFNYLASPALFLYVYGTNNLISLIVICIFISSGVVRLSKFNIIGTIEEGNEISFLGMPVFWSQYLVVILFVVSWYIPRNAFIILTDLSLLGMSFCMVLNRQFVKPRWYILAVFIMLAIIIYFFCLHFTKA